jgi:hypothetical protein
VVVKHDDVIGRLRSLSRQSVDDRVASAHLDRAAAAAAVRAGSHQRAALVAAACLAAVALPAAGIVLARAGHGSDPARNQPVLPAVEWSCPGEAPVIAADRGGDTIAAGAADRQAGSDELVQGRAVTCPRPEDVVDSTPPAECLGPPSGTATPAESADPKAKVVPSTKADGAATQGGARRECRPATSNTPTTVTGAPPTSTTVGLHAPASAAEADSARASTATQPGPQMTVANPSNNGDRSADNGPTPADAEAGPPPGASNSAADVDHPSDHLPAAEDEAEPGPPPGVPGPTNTVPAADPGRDPAMPGPPEDVSGPPEGVPDQAAGGR